MDHYSILDNHPAQVLPETASLTSGSRAGAATATAVARETLRFPGEDGGKSLSEMAQRDLDAALQLLAERAQYITGASGAAIALRDGATMICCASAGPSAPELGAHLQIDSGLSAESVRTKQTLRCDDAANDPRVNRESCLTFGIASVVVMPLVRGEEVYGVFELLSGRPHAFEERDFVALQRLADMIQTAVEHAEAARRAEKELGGKPEPELATVVKAGPQTVSTEVKPHSNAGTKTEKLVPAPESKTELPSVAPTATPTAKETDSAPKVTSVLAANPASADIPAVKPGERDQDRPVAHLEYGNVRTCAACGFPVSEGRRLCLDCEAASPSAIPASSETPEFFSQLSDESNPSWVGSHVYLIATVLIVAATIAVVLWRF
jgi:hypothetical protein